MVSFDLEYFEKKYNVEFYCKSHTMWEQFLNFVKFVPCEYEEKVMNYYSAWIHEKQEEYIDLSMYLYSDTYCIGLWSLCCKKFNGKWILGSFYHEIEEPIFISDISESTKRKYMNKCYEIVCEVAKILGMCTLQFYTKQSFEGASLWYKIIQENGGCVSEVDNMLYMDLRKDEGQIWGTLRRRYRSYINKCKKEWVVSLIDYYDSDKFMEYKNYHHYIAGRVTRGDASWKYQENALMNRKAFMILLYDIKSDELVGASYFFISKDEAIYLSGAYDRTRFATPVSHIVQYMAICYAKQRGLLLYRVGEKYYKNQSNNCSEKEMTIAEFKEGFASNMFVNMICKVDI